MTDGAPLRRWPTKAIDLAWGDWAYAMAAALLSADRNRRAREVEARFASGAASLAAYSVRTAFDLALRTVAWEPGDELVFTALTIADMPRIARSHALRCLPVDVDPETLLPRPGALAAVVGPRTRGLVMTHLFGARLELAPLLEEARRAGLFVFEDCAQAYAGPGWGGTPGADLSLFSFGPVKTATALGGAVAVARDPSLAAGMRATAEQDPMQSRGSYLRRVFIYGALKAASQPVAYGALVRLLRALGVDDDALVHKLTRAFPGADLTPRIRRRPSAGLLALLARRLDEGAWPVERRIRPAARVLAALGDDVMVPARAARPHGWWLLPVLVDDPDGLVAHLRARGFDATRGRSLPAVEDDTGRAPPTHGARRVLERMVWLPFSPSMPDPVVDRLGREVRASLGREVRAGPARPPA